MRNTFLAASAAALAFISTPAFAQDASPAYSGPRIGVVIGSGGADPFEYEGETIGVDAGYDFEIGNGTAVAGIGVEYQTDLGDAFLDINETAILGRVGGKFAGSNTLLYVNGGYTRISTGATPFGDITEDGFRGGVGIEFPIGNSGPSIKIEQRYLNYGGEGGEVFQTAAGLSFRF
jgi:hypothetical protein